MPTAGVDDPELETRRKPELATAGKDGEHSPSKRGSETKDSSPTKPWLPFTLALLTLFASLGGNVFLGWIAWESYNRGRAANDRFEESKPSLSS